MAITQTSKIQIRTGNLSDLPQLAVGELAYATDANRLFIGNDSTSSFLVPTNTEILTVFSDVPASGSNGDVLFNNSGTIGGESSVGSNSNVSLFKYDYLGGSDGNGLLTVNNIKIINNSNLGSISNVTITGGSAGQVLSTDGSGSLSFTSPAGAAPATSSSTGTPGQIAYASGFIYVCVAVNTWQRAALTTF